MTFKIIYAKSEGEETIKAVFNDEIVGLAGNSITDKMMTDFQQKRERRYAHV